MKTFFSYFCNDQFKSTDILGVVYPKSVIRDSFLLFLMTAIRKLQSYLSDCQQFTIFTTQKKSYSYDA